MFLSPLFYVYRFYRKFEFLAYNLCYRLICYCLGGKSKDGYSLISFPDNGLFHTLSDNEYIKLLSYITSVPM